jgi:hypothetical protein
MALEAKRTYLCVVDTIEPIVSSVKGTPGLKLRLVVSAGPDKGTSLTDRIYYTGKKKSDWKKTDFLLACNEKSLGKTDAISLMEKFTGKKVLVRTAWEEGRTAEDGTEYEGQIRIGGFQVSAQSAAPTSDSSTPDNTEVPF